MTNKHIKQTMGPIEWAMLVTLSMVWGGSFFFNRVAVNEIPVFTVVAGRVFLAAVILWMIILATRTPLPREGKIYAQLLLLGFVNSAIPFSLIVWGQSHISSGLASILNATTPFFTVIVANALLADEKLTVMKLSGVITGIAGVAAMVGVSALGEAGDHLLGELAIVGASIAYATGTTFARRLRALPPLVLAAGQITSSAIIMVPLALLLNEPWNIPVPSTAALASVASLATISTAFAYLLYFRILRSAGATNVALVTFLVPISAVLLGILFLNEQLELRQVGGMLAIGAGLALIDGRLIRRLKGQAMT